MSGLDAAFPLPVMRDELSLHPGPKGSDGSSSWTLRDPVRNRFFRIGWPAFEILSRWYLGDAAGVAEAVSAETTLQIDATDVVTVARFLGANHLTRPTGPADAARLRDAAAAENGSWIKWLLHHYLFFRLPVLKPDRFLARTELYVRWFAGRSFRLCSLLALICGLAMVVRQWDGFAATLLDTFTLPGMVTYGIALAGAKLVHEFAHAYTAKRLGCRVPTMGVAFLVMWPVLYTDVNDTWLLPDRRDRLSVGAAGVLAELTLAAWATLLWGLLGDGPLRQAAFVLATATWVSSVLINLSPFMRFDGYFLAMDALDLPNLHPRSFALARWWLREALFGLGEAPPERFRPAKRRALVAFAFAVWVYRLVVFLGIAVLVYHFFIKLVGIGLFAVEVGWFVVLPVWNEVAAWRKRGKALLSAWRGRASLGGLALIILAVVLPWHGEIGAPAILLAGEHFPLFPPAPARIAIVQVSDGQRVVAGDVLFRLESPDVTYARAQAERKIVVLEHDLGATGFDPALQSKMQSLREELRSAVMERLAAEREAERLTITAPTNGTVVDLMPDLQPGQWLSPKDRLASVIGGDTSQIVAYVSEDAIDRLSERAAARFVPTAPGHPSIRAKVVGIERTALHHLDAPTLASVVGGPIAVRAGDHSLTPEQAVYRVRLSTEMPVPQHELVGSIRIDGTGRSLLDGLWRSTVSMLVREGSL